MSKKCPKCNTLNDNTSKFCINCGQELIYNNIPQNNPSNQYQQNYNQNQNNYRPTNQTSPATTTVVVILVVIIVIVLLSAISAFLLYMA